jgi:hypothetical protein
VLLIAGGAAVLLPRAECPPGYYTWDAGSPTAFCGLPQEDDWGFDARDNGPLRLAVAGLGLVAAGALLLFSWRRTAAVLALVSAIAVVLFVGASRPPETLSQRANELAAQIPCPFPRCEGLSLEQAMREKVWTPNIFAAYSTVGSAVAIGLSPGETREYLDDTIADRRAPRPLPMHEDGRRR